MTLFQWKMEFKTESKYRCKCANTSSSPHTVFSMDTVVHLARTQITTEGKTTAFWEGWQESFKLLAHQLHTTYPTHLGRAQGHERFRRKQMFHNREQTLLLCLTTSHFFLCICRVDRLWSSPWRGPERRSLRIGPAFTEASGATAVYKIKICRKKKKKGCGLILDHLNWNYKSLWHFSLRYQEADWETNYSEPVDFGSPANSKDARTIFTVPAITYSMKLLLLFSSDSPGTVSAALKSS